VAKGGPGSLMAEGEPVVVLVPTDVPLIAEIGIRSSETGLIAIGDPVTLKVDAFPWRRHGTLQGRLQDVSHGSFTPEGSATALHSGRVTLAGALTNLTPGTGPLPGMTLTAEIKTGTRTVLDYFLEPLMRGLDESLREP
jgi:HlyD family secretion protein